MIHKIFESALVVLVAIGYLAFSIMIGGKFVINGAWLLIVIGIAVFVCIRIECKSTKQLCETMQECCQMQIQIIDRDAKIRQYEELAESKGLFEWVPQGVNEFGVMKHAKVWKTDEEIVEFLIKKNDLIERNRRK